MSDRAPTKAEVHHAVQTLLAYGIHGTRADQPAPVEQSQPAAPAKTPDSGAKAPA